MGRQNLNTLKSLVERFGEKGFILEPMIRWNCIKMGVNKLMCKKKRYRT
jgi:hypothetical protein